MKVAKAASMSKAASCARALLPTPEASATAAIAAVPRTSLRVTFISEFPERRRAALRVPIVQRIPTLGVLGQQAPAEASLPAVGGSVS